MTALLAYPAAAVHLACASPGVPPGGPVDTEAPVVVTVAPDSGQVNASPRSVVFRFNEVVSERPSAAASLAALFLISPQEGNPVVDWSRSEISVRQRRGWRRNTTYTITLLPGVADLRGNVSREGKVIVFSTGATIPQTRLSGRTFDWGAGRLAIGALVQAVTPDSLVYSTVTDSAGTFALQHLPPGQYTVQAILDDNRNRALDPRERFDSATVVLTDTLSVDLLAFVRDSVPPRLTAVEAQDSVTLRLGFDLPLDPQQAFAPEQFRIVGSDSALIAVRTAMAAAPDTTSIPLPRPAPPRRILLQMVTPVRASSTYTVRATDVRGLTGVAGTSERQLRTPASFAADTTAAATPPLE